jgi:CMP-N-acetylneuraminic acid synthetase
MLKNKKVLAIIPARGGSKRLPGKNIKNLLGKPLIAWTIEQAKKSKYIDKLIVSTDDKEIAEISKKYGAEVPFLRPKELAKDDSPTADAVFHTLAWFKSKGDQYDVLVLLEPTSPLRKNEDVDKAIELFFKNYDKADSLVSVGKIQLENPFLAKKIENGYVKPLIKTNECGFQKQQLVEAYFPYGVIYLSKVDAYRKHKTFYQQRTIPYFIERWQNYEIDDIYDFICVEAILKQKLKEKKL